MSKKAQILTLLSDCQPHSSKELIPITHRYSAVIHKLREEGHQINSWQVARYDWFVQML